MRTEKEIIDLIIDTAKSDERIRAVSMEGSRADPNTPKDKYMDYDISYYVTDVKSFVTDKLWISIFGTLLILQEPEWNDNAADGFSDEKHDFNTYYGYLMLFDDGTRIDLSIKLVTEKDFFDMKGEPTITLLDKDNVIPLLPAPSEKAYRVKKPNIDMFTACCNNFWWCLNNVAKGIARDELPYVMNMYNVHVREMHDKMITWYIGFEHDFSVSVGKDGKYFKCYLPPKLYKKYTATYSDSDYKNIWNAVLTACELFHNTALKVAEHLNTAYNQSEENGMIKYLHSVKADCTK